MGHDNEVRQKVEKYMRLLSNPAKIGSALRHLNNIHMTLELLSETGVGKAVNQLRNHCDHGNDALQLVEKWKEIARSYGLRQRRRHSSSSSSKNEDSSPTRKKEKCEVEGSSVSKKEKSIDCKKPSSKLMDEPRCSTSFAEMLASADTAKPWKPKKHKTNHNHWKCSEIDINYKPSRPICYEPSPVIRDHQNGILQTSEADTSMFKPRKDKRKIYAGRRKGDIGKEIPSLQELCIRLLTANINAIEQVGDAPYYLLKPILEKCDAYQLSAIERRNPHLTDDTDELWEKIVRRTYPRCELDEYESWRDCYVRIRDENDKKLKILSTRINQHNRETTAPVKTALLADAKAPRDVRKRQIRYGTGHSTYDLPCASEVSKARKAIFEKGNKDSLSNLPVSVRNTNSSLGAHSTKKPAQSKKGALMIKTLKMMKNSFKR